MDWTGQISSRVAGYMNTDLAEDSLCVEGAVVIAFVFQGLRHGEAAWCIGARVGGAGERLASTASRSLKVMNMLLWICWPMSAESGGLADAYWACPRHRYDWLPRASIGDDAADWITILHISYKHS